MDLNFTTIGILALSSGYLAGSIPFGLVLCYLGGYGDIRKIGSGNIGATNVLRTGNKIIALLTLILDSGKGAFIVLVFGLLTNVTNYYEPEKYADPILVPLTAGVGAIIGHCFPVWLKFKGGKGVATTLGTLLAAVPWAGLCACAVWLITALITRISSLSALIAMLSAPIAAFILYGPAAAALCAMITALVFWRHTDNIKRICGGTESKIGQKKREEPLPKPDNQTE